MAGTGRHRFVAQKQLAIIESLYSWHRLTTPDKACYLIRYLRNDGGVNVIGPAASGNAPGGDQPCRLSKGRVSSTSPPASPAASARSCSRISEPDVIKVESPGGGGLRDFGPFADLAAGPETGALHLYLDTSKRSITLDLATPSGQAVLGRLLATADALVDDRPLGTLESEGFSANRLANDFPRLVVSYLSTYGQSGPYAQRPSTNITAFAVGGQMATTGDPDREPLKNGGSQADYQLGLNGFTATLAGLWAAGDSGEGDAIDVSGMECMASTLELMLNTYSYAKIDYWNGRKGNVLSGVLGLYPCENGYLGVHAMPRNFPAPLGSWTRIGCWRMSASATPPAGWPTTTNFGRWCMRGHRNRKSTRHTNAPARPMRRSPTSTK